MRDCALQGVDQLGHGEKIGPSSSASSRVPASVSRLSLLKILSQEKLEQLRKSRATSRDESMRVAGSTISGCRVIQI
jgi:hypothetical protein